MPNYSTHIINGKKCKIVRVHSDCLQDEDCPDVICYGMCEDPSLKDSNIFIDKDLKGFEETRVTCHEILHFCDFKMSEKKVDKISRDIAKVLWKLGYRKKKRNGH